MATSDTGKLGGWIVGVRLESWKKNRRPANLKWLANLAAYRIRPDIDYAATTENKERKEGEVGYPLTRQKVTTAHASLRDVLLPGNRLSFMLLPESERDAQLLDDQQLAAEEPDETGLLSPEAERAAEIRQQVAEAEALITEQLEACDGPEEVNQAVFTGCLYGTMFMKRSIGSMERERFIEIEPGLYMPDLGEETTVSIEHVDPWSMYWDMDARRLQDGEGCIHRTHSSPYDLRQSLGQPLYDDAAIRRVLEQHEAAAAMTGGETTEETPKRRAIEETTRTIETLELWGLAPEKLVAEYEREAGLIEEPEPGEEPDEDQPDEKPAEDSAKGDEDAGRMVEIHAIVCNVAGDAGSPEVIRFTRTRRQDRPYFKADLFWEPDDIVSSGIADTVANEQRVLNDLVKSLKGNVDQVARLIFGMRGALADGTVEIVEKGNALVVQISDGSVGNINEVLSQFKIEGAIRELIEAINQWLAFADLSSGIPRAEQGNQEPTPQTLGELRERMNRAGKMLGAILLNIDRMIEDIIRSMYRWNLINPDLQRGKGLYRVKALGYTGFMSKYEKVQGLLRILELALTHPRLERETNIRRMWEDVVRAHELDPDEALRPVAEVAAEEREEAEAARAEAAAQAEAEAGAGGGGEPPPPTEEELAAQDLANQVEAARIEKDLADAEQKRATADEKRTRAAVARAEGAARAIAAPQPLSPAAAGATGGEPI